MNYSIILFLKLPPPPRYTLFPYTTLFRSTLARLSTILLKEEVRQQLMEAETADNVLQIINKYDQDDEEEKADDQTMDSRSEEHTSELQSRGHLVCRLLLEKKKKKKHKQRH